MIDRNKLKKLLRARLDGRVTDAQIALLAEKLIEIKHPTRGEMEKISSEITGSRVITESLDIDDIVTMLDQADQ